ncbi:MAG: flagellar hook-basal body complex protein FliE [Paracoccus sp. (in: a-proteobacteria)]|nr:flagellar hook-basal body complex protein FliE [Paracoccus sp. (in: a-proteobacteria)]
MITASSALNAYQAARDAAQPAAGADPAIGARFQAVLEQADRAAIGTMQGQVDTHVLVQSIAEAELALEAAVAIRDKVVEAYQEILRMPV